MTGISLAEVERRALAWLDALLDLPPETRETALGDSGEDAAVVARVRALLGAGEIDAARLRTGMAAHSASDPDLPDRIGAYRITALIGQGGMGAVYRGERATGDFDHVVAIKLIRPGALSQAFVERFARERQTLARLSHPHIARLFDGGETAAGEPYIVMELVDGMRLDKWMAARPPRAARVRLFLDVCAAVGFAHQNLIVHRDLTPANILVDAAGSAKLIDFGISRPPMSAQAGDPAHSLTPGFAAPERLAGDPATTLTDIYSLGVLLSAMLGKTDDADLAAIVGQASATDPAERYQSADALAADVRAWERGDVVAARRGGKRYRAVKFIARHRAGVVATALAAVLLVGALTLTLIANGRAETARAEAETRFAQTRAIAKSLLFEAYDEVGKVPGATSARIVLAETGQTYLQALAAQDDAPIDVRIETGLGFLRLSQVVGGGGDSQQGRLEDGSKLLKRAAAVLTPLHRDRPADPAATLAYASLLVEQAAVALYTDNDAPAARAKALEAQRLLAPVATRDVEAARLYAATWQGLGDSYGWSDDYARARDAYLAGERFIVTLRPALRDARPVRMVASATARLLGEAQHKLGQETLALAACDRAVLLNRSLVADDPDNPALVRKLALSLWYRANVLRANKLDTRAVASITEAVKIARELRERSNGDATSLQLVAITGEVQAQILGDLGRHAEAMQVSDEVIAAHRQMVRLAGDTSGARRSMATALETSGANYYKGGTREKACATWREALALLAGNRTLGAADRAGIVPRLTSRIAQCAAGVQVTAFDSV